MGKERDNSRDALIVGAGPTGLSAAIFLAHRGIKPRIIEKEEKRAPYYTGPNNLDSPLRLSYNEFYGSKDTTGTSTGI